MRIIVSTFLRSRPSESRGSHGAAPSSCNACSFVPGLVLRFGAHILDLPARGIHACRGNGRCCGQRVCRRLDYRKSNHAATGGAGREAESGGEAVHLRAHSRRIDRRHGRGDRSRQRGRCVRNRNYLLARFPGHAGAAIGNGAGPRRPGRRSFPHIPGETRSPRRHCFF